MRGFGGMLSFSLRGGFDAVKRVLPRLRLAHLAANLAPWRRSPACRPRPATWSAPPRSAPRWASRGLVRYSVGIEDAQDLIADLEQAFIAA